MSDGHKKKKKQLVALTLFLYSVLVFSFRELLSCCVCLDAWKWSVVGAAALDPQQKRKTKQNKEEERVDHKW